MHPCIGASEIGDFTVLIDILFIISILIIAWFGWKAGLVRSFFAVAAGFVALWAASHYPYQEGINFYIIFAVTVLVIFIVGAFILRILEFFYLRFIDRILGLALNVAVWVIVSVNIIIPTVFQNHAQQDIAQNNKFYNTISNKVHKITPMFKDYVIEKQQ